MHNKLARSETKSRLINTFHTLKCILPLEQQSIVRYSDKFPHYTEYCCVSI